MKTNNPERLNGVHKLDENDYIRVQWYPNVGSYYAIINDNPALQISLSEKQLNKILKK